MSRRDDLIKILNKTDNQNELKAGQLIDEIIFMEEQLIELRKLPFISVNPKNPAQQKSTPAGKLYKELMQQYNSALRLLFRLSGDMGETEEESPLRTWAKKRKDSDDN